MKMMKNAVEEKAYENQETYQRTQMQKDMILERLREQGCRITRQRQLILDIILAEECSCCKEIYFLASKRDPNIGMATIYRMINLLEEIGALKRKRAYRICNEESPVHICSVKLDDYTSIRLDGEKLRQVIEKGMESFGYLHDRRVRSISMESGE